MRIISRIINKYKTLSKPAKASLWFVACYVIQRGLQFIGMPIYTRIMSTEDYGTYSVFLSWFNLICVFTSLNIYSGTFNKAMVKYEEKRAQYISSVQWLTLFVGLAFSIVIICCNKFITDKTGYSLKLQLLMCLHLVLFPSLQYWSQKQRFLFEYKKLVAVTLTNSVASLLLGIFFVLISDDKSFALIAVTVAVQAVINGILFVTLSREGKTVYHKEFWTWTAVTAIPLIPHYLSEILLGHADRLMIDQMCGTAQAGIYNIVYQISMVMTILRTGINGSYAPWLYYSLKNREFNQIRKIARLITVMMASLTLFFMLIGPEILKIVAPPSYYEAVIGIPAIMLGCFFIFVYVLFMYVEIYYEKTKGVAVASIIAAVTNVVLNYVCIQQFGYIAAAYTTMMSYMLMSIMHYLFLRKIFKSDPELKGVYDFRMLLLISIALVISGVVLGQLYNNSLLRFTLIAVLLIIGFIKRGTIINTVKLLKNRE